MEQLVRDRLRGFLVEAFDPKRVAAAEPLAADDPAVLDLGSRRSHPDQRELRTRLLQCSDERRGVRDVVIRGQERDAAARVANQHAHERQQQPRTRVEVARLHDELEPGVRSDLRARDLLVIGPDDDHDPVLRRHQQCPLDRRLKQRRVACEHGELLGQIGTVQRTRERVQPLAFTACEDNDPRSGVWHSLAPNCTGRATVETVDQSEHRAIPANVAGRPGAHARNLRVCGSVATTARAMARPLQLSRACPLTRLPPKPI